MRYLSKNCGEEISEGEIWENFKPIGLQLLFWEVGCLHFKDLIKGDSEGFVIFSEGSKGNIANKKVKLS